MFSTFHLILLANICSEWQVNLCRSYFFQMCQNSNNIQRSWEILNLSSLCCGLFCTGPVSSWIISFFCTISNVPLQELLECSLFISLFSLKLSPNFLVLSHKNYIKMSRLQFVINKFNRLVLILIDRWVACVWQNLCMMCSTVGCCVYIVYMWFINSDRLISPVS